MAGLVLATVLPPDDAAACSVDNFKSTFFIDETTDFTGRGGACENTDLNTVTASLRNELACRGWTGSRYLNISAWPEDFFDNTIDSIGLDHQWGDTKRIAVYAGHGNRSFWQFGYPGPNSRSCSVNLSTRSLLGRASGAVAGAVIHVTSCTLNADSLARVHRHNARQHFGYHNSPAVKDNQPRDFFIGTKSRTNVNAWLDEMEDRPGIFTGDNSPMVLSYGVNANDAAAVRDVARLRQGAMLGTVAHTFFFFVFRNHGSTGC